MKILNFIFNVIKIGVVISASFLGYNNAFWLYIIFLPVLAIPSILNEKYWTFVENDYSKTEILQIVIYGLIGYFVATQLLYWLGVLVGSLVT